MIFFEMCAAYSIRQKLSDTNRVFPSIRSFHFMLQNVGSLQGDSRVALQKGICGRIKMKIIVVLHRHRRSRSLASLPSAVVSLKGSPILKLVVEVETNEV